MDFLIIMDMYIMLSEPTHFFKFLFEGKIVKSWHGKKRRCDGLDLYVLFAGVDTGFCNIFSIEFLMFNFLFILL